MDYAQPHTVTWTGFPLDDAAAADDADAEAHLAGHDRVHSHA